MDARCASLLRACVLGAESTPYAHGAFLFDILLPASFPDAPPRVTFLTTGGGAWRANPNLYHNGMVCLSLLGTWEGPGWEARTSTLLQLLVSLQALVLNDEPYFNEPGCDACMSEAAVREQKRRVLMRTCDAASVGKCRYEPSRGQPAAAAASREYTLGCRAGTLMHAVAEPLRQLAASSAVAAAAAAATPAAPFAALLREHFGRKAAAMRATCAEWEADGATTTQHARAGIRGAAAAALSALSTLPPHVPAPDEAAAAAAAPDTPAGKGGAAAAQ